MAFKLTETASAADFETPPEGVFPARCYRLVDLGTVAGDWQGRPTHNRKVLISFELLGEDCAMSDGRPFAVSRRFSLSLSEKSSLRAFVQQWRGKPFTAEELAGGFDLHKLLGAPALLTVAHVERAGRQYANIVGVSALPKNYPCPPGVNKPVAFDLDDFDQSVFDGLSQGLQAQIMASPEYAAHATSGPLKRPEPARPAPAPQAPAAAPAAQAKPAPTPYPFGHAPKPRPQPAAALADGFDDDIPF
jgi:cell division septation protein DedD